MDLGSKKVAKKRELQINSIDIGRMFSSHPKQPRVNESALILMLAST